MIDRSRSEMYYKSLSKNVRKRLTLFQGFSLPQKVFQCFLDSGSGLSQRLAYANGTTAWKVFVRRVYAGDRGFELYKILFRQSMADGEFCQLRNGMQSKLSHDAVFMKLNSPD
jgi:hypothetical protein